MSQMGISFGDAPKRPTALGVRELVDRAHRTVESAFGPVWVEGEIANLKLAPSGHAYFTLREGNAALSCAMWRSSVQRLRFRLESGAQVRVHGELGIYAAQGKFQMYVDRAEAAGLGDLMARYERLKAKLAAEGLFDAALKRPLPRAPRTIGVVTSPSGAAIHDICKVIGRRRPSHILLSPARVQGAQAPAEIRQALERLACVPGVDVIIVGRGGGSIEDLWAFNDEALARAVRACLVPVISAVGHEVDTSLCDLVADVRAATPSQAGELVVPDRGVLLATLRGRQRELDRAIERRALDARHRLEQLRRRLEQAGSASQQTLRAELARLDRRLRRAVQGLLPTRQRKLEALRRALERRDPRAQIHGDRRRFAAAHSALASSMRQALQARRIELAGAASRVDAMSPLRVLDRGYALATVAGARSETRVVTDAGVLEVGDTLDIRLARGAVRTEVVAKLDDEARGPQR